MKNKTLNLLVTGGAGYIGAHFINQARLLDNVRIIVVDNFQQTRKNIIKDKKISYYEADLCDLKKLSRTFQKDKIDLVIHFAALANVPESVASPDKYYLNNLVGGLNLLDCMLKNQVKKIIFSSSASVYGEPQSDVIKENHPTIPTNPYGFTKLIFEKMLKDYHRAYGLNSISLRYFCAAGCDESLIIGEYHQPETHVIPNIIFTLLGKRKEFYVYGDDYPTPDGTGIRDYIHVNDLSQAHLLAMNKLLTNKRCEVYNLGINQGFSVMELIKVAEKISGKKLNYKIKARRPGDPSRLIADSTKAQKEFNWQPKYNKIDQIILTAYNFFKAKL